MRKIFISSLAVLVFSFTIFSQGRGTPVKKETVNIVKVSVNPTAPVKWETYLTEGNKISILFPKLPLILFDDSNNCVGESSQNYVVYADRKVYVLRTIQKVKPNEYCQNKKQFSPENFTKRIQSLNVQSGTSPIPTEVDGLKLYKFFASNGAMWLYDDGKGNGWFELKVLGSSESDKQSTNFLESLKIADNQKGISIGIGAGYTIGDEVKPEETKSIDSEIKTSVTEESKAASFKIYFQPRAAYTDNARKNGVQGVVRLKVIFSENGGIGAISVVSGLAEGLTEQSIAAARKIVFIPLSSENKTLPVSKIVEYRFTLY